MAEGTLLVMGFAGMPSWAQDGIRRLSEQARARELRLLGADTPQNLAAADPATLAHVDETVPLDVHDAEACRAWAIGRSDIDAVVTIRELAVHTTAVVAEQLGLPGNEPAAVQRMRAKDRCRERLRQAGLPQPQTAVCDSQEEARAFMDRTGPGPWVVKPRAGLGSVGVSLVRHPHDLPGALRKVAMPHAATAPLSPDPSFLMETFVDGDEFSAEGVLIGGVPQVLALTRKYTNDGFISVRQQVPAGLCEETASQASSAVARALTAVGITHGIFHVEFWVTPTGVVLGELHGRPGGDYIHALVELTRPGLELYGMLIDDLLERPVVPPPDPAGAARVDFLFPPPGLLRQVLGWNALTDHPSVVAADLQVAPGDVIMAELDSYTRPGVFVTCADTLETLTSLADALRSSIVFDVDGAAEGIGTMHRPSPTD